MKEPKLKANNFKNIVDNFLIVNLFLIIAGFFFFLISVLASINGNYFPYQIFQQLWFPLFIPALSTFFTAVLVQATLSNFSKK
tara:strand:- start:1237 stop:1485 length:249 start_codon:yes stop_codon:yes gene_type:complete